MRPVAYLAGALLAALAILPAAAQDWRPERVTLLVGHAGDGREGQLAHALAAAWSRTLGARVTVEARGRGTELAAATEFARRPRDGTVVLGGDLGALALAYARMRPQWTWARSLEHLGVYGRDPVALYAGPASPWNDIAALAATAREANVTVAVARWHGLDALVLADAAAQARLRVEIVPAGTGAGIAAILSTGRVPLALARRSALARGRDIEPLASASAIPGEAPPRVAGLDAALGTVTPPAGGVAVVSVHAGFQKAFPARHERLRRSFAAAREDAKFRDSLADLGWGVGGSPGPDAAALSATVQLWWDAWRRSGHALAQSPPPVITRGKIAALEDGGHRLRYLGLDGKVHELALDPDATEVLVAGTAVAGAAPLHALKPGMLCDIAWPAALAQQASRLDCR